MAMAIVITYHPPTTHRAAKWRVTLTNRKKPLWFSTDSISPEAIALYVARQNNWPWVLHKGDIDDATQVYVFDYATKRPGEVFREEAIK